MVTDLLAAYDSQLREAAEVASAARSDRDGPLLRALFDRDAGFVTYRTLEGFDGPGDGALLDALIARTVTYFETQTSATSFEWKTRGRDLPADLGSRLERHGLVPDDVETVMVGDVGLLAVGGPAPAGVTVRRVGVDADGTPHPPSRVRADLSLMLAMQSEAFGVDRQNTLDSLVARVLDQADTVEVWVAELVPANGAPPQIVCAGRLEIVPGTDFAGLWGGATLGKWRGRGIYRALTAARARSAQARGVRYLQSDCTGFSRPILERSGLVAITTTTPYVWRRSR